MNIHPIFVHFPIALLTIYALLEVFIPIKIAAYKAFKWENFWAYKLLINPIWQAIKAFLVIVGTLIGLLTLETGEMAEELVRSTASDPRVFGTSQMGQLIEMHSTFAGVSIGIFAALAVGYIAYFIEKKSAAAESSEAIHKFMQKFGGVVTLIRKIVLNPWVAAILALVGLVAITITGALGGAIVYGPDVDPAVKMIYGWFF